MYRDMSYFGVFKYFILSISSVSTFHVVSEKRLINASSTYINLHPFHAFLFTLLNIPSSISGESFCFLHGMCDAVQVVLFLEVSSYLLIIQKVIFNQKNLLIYTFEFLGHKIQILSEFILKSHYASVPLMEKNQLLVHIAAYWLCYILKCLLHN